MHSSNHLFSEDDVPPLSGLQYLRLCVRHWALIHIEQLWVENRLTEEWRVLHKRVHESGTEARPDVVVREGCACGRCSLACPAKRTLSRFNGRRGGTGAVAQARFKWRVAWVGERRFQWSIDEGTPNRM